MVANKSSQPKSIQRTRTKAPKSTRQKNVESKAYASQLGRSPIRVLVPAITTAATIRYPSNMKMMRTFTFPFGIDNQLAFELQHTTRLLLLSRLPW
jgi:hypothetical protein